MVATKATVLGAASVLGLANGHLMMSTPHPYNLLGPGATGKALQVNPLGADFPFPCQGLSGVEHVTPMQAGQTQLVKFSGSAVHGGGSCQFSVTYDFPPPADPSKWKVVYSVIGGCPADSAGNLQESTAGDVPGRMDGPHCNNDSGVECLRQFDVPIPAKMASGNATFAWTWFNRLGNREMYMNCAPVTITGGTDDSAYLDSLPTLFTANIPGACNGPDSGIVPFPHPGDSVKLNQKVDPGNLGNCPTSNGAPVGGSGPASTGPASTGGLFFDTAPSNTPAAAPPPPVTAPTPAPASGPTTKVPCSTDGTVVCIGNDQFGLCNNGLAVPQRLAPGTTCSAGKVTKRWTWRLHDAKGKKERPSSGDDKAL